MLHSIRVRLILIFIGLAVVPLLAAGIILALAAVPAVRLAVILLIAAVLAAGIAAILGLVTARRIIEPIRALTEAANAIGAGDLASRALTPSDDEIGILAGTFNHLARQVRDRIGTLEHRIAEQTKALATFREISRLSAMLDEKQLATEVVERIKNSFRFYQSQIFFFDESGEYLIPASGTGEACLKMPAEGYRIPKGKGAVGRAAESNLPVLVGDTAHDTDAKSYPLPPKIKSEAAVPIAVGDRVLGVLDVQQNIVNGITPAEVDLLQSVANQVALAVHKARGQTPDREQAEREALIASINQKIRETTSAESALRVAVLELGRALGSEEARVVIAVSPQEIASGPGGGG